MNINCERLWEWMQYLSNFGAEPNRPDLGITRQSYSPVYRAAGEALMRRMNELGMHTWIDAAGNIFGRLEGTGKGAPCVMVGSHFDTVPRGGRYDGLAGVVAALEAVTCIKESGLSHHYPIELAALVNEEACQFKGGVMGSRAMAGLLALDHPQKTFDNNGNCLADAMRSFGARPDVLTQAVRSRGDLLAFLELHIEQASLLDEQALPVGIVTSIAGIHQLLVYLHGRADHACGTPLNRRRDTLAAAAKIACDVNDLAASASPNTRGTVGYIRSVPGEHNIVAAESEMAVDFREADPDIRNKLYADFLQVVDSACKHFNVDYEIKLTLDRPPVVSDARIMALYHQSAQNNGIPCMDLISYAAHDSMILANLCPIGMIFIRCEKGLSHCPQENIRQSDLESGTQILLDALNWCAVNGL